MKNIITHLVSLILSAVLLTGCFGTNDPASSKASAAESSEVNSATETESLTETEPEIKDLYPYVPDELEESYFLCSKNKGRCKSLTGKVHVLAVLIDDAKSVWDDGSVSELSGVLSETFRTIEAFADGYSAELQLDYSFARVSRKVTLSWNGDKYWRDTVLQDAGYGSIDEADGLIREEFSADTGVVLFCFNREERSFAEAAASEDGTEYAVIYEHDVSTYLHEMLHLFGTMDYYYPKNISDTAEKYFSGTTMASGNKPVVDSLSAFVIGWTEELSEDALAFLRETSHFSMKDAEIAGEAEIFTGKVKDRPLKGYVDGVACEIGLYTGDVVNGVPEGEGEARYHNGDYGSGTFGYGVLNGEGEYVWSNGDRYVGHFVDGELCGEGEIIFANGDRYVGGFLNGEFHGTGTFTWPNGDRYAGEYFNGAYQGTGTYTWADGSFYVGEFKGGSLTGYGVYTNAFGDVLEGYFEDWKYVG